MTTSKRLSERKIAKFEKNITKRGLSALSANKSLEPAHIVLMLFAVLVIASFVFQIIRMALKSEAAA